MRPCNLFLNQQHTGPDEYLEQESRGLPDPPCPLIKNVYSFKAVGRFTTLYHTTIVKHWLEARENNKYCRNDYHQPAKRNWLSLGSDRRPPVLEYSTPPTELRPQGKGSTRISKGTTSSILLHPSHKLYIVFVTYMYL